jgi:hypothetical protein
LKVFLGLQIYMFLGRKTPKIGFSRTARKGMLLEIIE